jgi:membrane protease YdiL (CAAX protease family)
MPLLRNLRDERSLSSMPVSPTYVLLGFVALWLTLDRLAASFGSTRGEAGLLVCAAVLVLAVAIEVLLTGRNFPAAVRALGLTMPCRHGLFGSLALGAALLFFYPLVSLATGMQITLQPQWLSFVPGIFAQAGIAEETVFRGFLFRHLRIGRTFWRAAILSAIPFCAVHLLLFMTLDFPVALASFLLSLSLSFPLAWLFERSGNSIWPAAILHSLIQGSIKLMQMDERIFLPTAIAWMCLSSAVPWLLFLVKPAPMHGSVPNR